MTSALDMCHAARRAWERTQPQLTITDALDDTTRRGAEVARRAHIPEVAGSIPAGGSVVRFYNIPECAGEAGNVFSLWESLPVSEPIPWTDCVRWFISAKQAVHTLVAAAAAGPGRFAPRPRQWHMLDLAEHMYPGRELVEVPRRRGDRAVEPLHAACERILDRPDFMVRIVSPHDPVLAVAA